MYCPFFCSKAPATALPLLSLSFLDLDPVKKKSTLMPPVCSLQLLLLVFSFPTRQTQEKLERRKSTLLDHNLKRFLAQS